MCFSPFFGLTGCDQLLEPRQMNSKKDRGLRTAMRMSNSIRTLQPEERQGIRSSRNPKESHRALSGDPRPSSIHRTDVSNNDIQRTRPNRKFLARNAGSTMSRKPVNFISKAFETRYLREYDHLLEWIVCPGTVESSTSFRFFHDVAISADVAQQSGEPCFVTLPA